MKFIKTDINEEINSLRVKHYENLKAPIDAMWELLYIASSQHYLIDHNEGHIGYCCIDENNSLIQIFLSEDSSFLMEKVVSELISLKLISSASLSTNEPIGFNACLSHSKSTTVNTFCFQHLNKEMEVNSTLEIELVSAKDIPAIKVFLKEQVGMDDSFGYTENLVSRKEIFMVKESQVIIATSECRMSDTQPDFADLGIIVKKGYEGKGIATEVMRMQVNRVLKASRKPICSTTFDNIASKRTIEKAGFYCSNIIFDIRF
ncbi:Acetyltransferase (GNAT) domain-containing protein [Spirosomataceae bacterium TFI 002]|nr:Acetyltransferase (GNAT) domain-containing protein [Spirosomataceae bacterium TFI 002]